LPIDVFEAPTLGVDDIETLVKMTPGVRVVIVDSFDRIVPPHLDELGHFARHRDAMMLSVMARMDELAIIATSSIVPRCAQCGAPNAGIFPSLAHDPTGLASEAEYVWALDRPSYWMRDGECELRVRVSGRDGTAGVLGLPMAGGVLLSDSAPGDRP
jgi:hypothetical protein